MINFIKQLAKDPIIDNLLLELRSKYRLAYPNTEQYFSFPGEHDTQKWLQAVKSVYYGEKNGVSRNHALRQATSDWNVTEVYDFLHWLRFYEEGNHLKYKTAQFYYGNADAGYLLPITKDPVPKPQDSNIANDIDFSRESINNELPAAEKRRIIERQRSKIVGRLDSAEKLLRQDDGELFAGKELDSLLEVIYNLKRKIQLMNKRSTATRIYDDMIVREANILNGKGFTKAANVLYSLAQSPPPTPPAPPAQPSGAPGGLPSVGPGSPPMPPPNNTPSNPEPGSTTPKGLADFLDGLKTGPDSDLEDKNKSDDILEVIDDELYIDDNDSDIIVEAQETPLNQKPALPISDKPILPPSEKPIISPPEKVELTPTTTEEPLLEGDEEDTPTTSNTKDVDKMVNAVFKDLTMADVVAKFEAIAKFYKTREMPRQLAFADMLLDSLGIASFFPSLSEATNKAHEANNYISTRIEDILGKLRGTMKAKEIDMVNKDQFQVSPEIMNARKHLEQETNKEIENKKLRKDIENKALQDQLKETPEIEIEEDLANKPPTPPVTTTPPLPKPISPAVPPIK